MNALVVDDSRAMRRIVGQILKEMGYAVTEAGNGREAIECLRQRTTPFDIALVDWNMPEMNGLEFVQTVRREYAADGICMMMVTSETEADKVAQALEAGADEYVMKPFTKDVLKDKLALLGMAAA